MNRKCFEGAMACVGAVIGAGFVSGREIMSFFTVYGQHSWWLILIAAGVMMVLTALCLRCVGDGCGDSWCSLYRHQGRWGSSMAEGCMLLLLCTTGGAMLSAAGHMVELLWASSWAYPMGLTGTLLLAWLMSLRSIKPLSWCSVVLYAVFLVGVVCLLRNDSKVQTVAVAATPDFGTLLWAGLRAAAYAAMNLALAIGVVCKVRQPSCCTNDRQAVLFGLMLICLLLVANHLYSRHPELAAEPFPIVMLFSGFGRTGFVTSVVLLYLAVLTTLSAILFALRSVMNVWVPHGSWAAALLTLGLPTLVSLVGFMGIVEDLYAPVGFLCLLVVFLPLLLSRKGLNGKEEK